MSKGLEALRFATRDFSSGRDENGNYFTKKDFDLDIIGKELKALEIIKNKKVDTLLLFRCFEIDNKYGCSHLEVYNLELYTIKLTQKEYDLLKEVLL